MLERGGEVRDNLGLLMEGLDIDSDEGIDAPESDPLVSIADIAAICKRECSTIEKWSYSQGWPPPAQKRPRRWRLSEVQEAVNARTDNRIALTDEQVREVLVLHNEQGLTQTEIAAAYSVSIGHISNIVNGKRRKTTPVRN